MVVSFRLLSCLGSTPRIVQGFLLGIFVLGCSKCSLLLLLAVSCVSAIFHVSVRGLLLLLLPLAFFGFCEGQYSGPPWCCFRKRACVRRFLYLPNHTRRKTQPVRKKEGCVCVRLPNLNEKDETTFFQIDDSCLSPWLFFRVVLDQFRLDALLFGVLPCCARSFVSLQNCSNRRRCGFVDQRGEHKMPSSDSVPDCFPSRYFAIKRLVLFPFLPCGRLHVTIDGCAAPSVKHFFVLVLRDATSSTRDLFRLRSCDACRARLVLAEQHRSRQHFPDSGRWNARRHKCCGASSD